MINNVKHSIIVVNYHSEKLLKKFENYKEKYEIIVIDNSESYCGTLTSYPMKNPGFGAACNRGAEEASGYYLHFINPDVGSLENLDDYCKYVETINMDSIVVAPVINGGTSIVVRNTLFAHLLSFKRELIRLGNQNSYLFLSGAFLSATKESFIEIGKFDENIFMYAEDLDFGLRARVSGYTNQIVDFVFEHTSGESSGRKTLMGKFARFKRSLAGHLYVMRKHKVRFALINAIYLASGRKM